MRTHTIYFILLCIIISLAGCESDTRGGLFVSHLPVQVDEEEEYYGFINRNGEIILEGEFEECPSPIIDNCFSVKESDGYKVYHLNEDGKYSLIPGLEGLYNVGYMQNGLMPVCRVGEHIQVVDVHGNRKFNLSYFGGVEVMMCWSYTDGLMRVYLADKTYLFVNTEGNPNTGKRYDYATQFKDGIAYVEYGDSSAIINTREEVLYRLKKGEEQGMVEPVLQKMIISRNDKKYLYTTSGEEICRLSSRVEDVVDFSKHGYIYENDCFDIGLMSYDGNQLIGPKYEKILPLGDYLLAKHEDIDNEIRLIDKNDYLIKTLYGDDAVDLHRSEMIDFPTIIETDDDEMYIVDNNGNKLCDKHVYKIEYDVFEDAEEFHGLVESHYLSVDSVVEQMYTMCGEGTGIPPAEFGVFFINNNRHCRPMDIPFIKNEDYRNYIGKKSALQSLSEGRDYMTNLRVFFDEIIADSTGLRNTPWVNEIGIYTFFDKMYHSKIVSDALLDKLEKSGCKILYSKSIRVSEFYILEGNTGENILILQEIGGINLINFNIMRNNDGIVDKLISGYEEQIKSLN